MSSLRTKLAFLVISAFLLGAAVQPASAETLLTTQTPAETNVRHSGSSHEKGLAFYSVTAGQITAVRFWKASKENGTHVGRIWSSGGTLLASVTFTSETSSGWQQQSLQAPLSIAANTTYIVSVNTTNRYYAYTNNGLDSQISSGSLRSVVGSNGRYSTTSGQFPSNGTSGMNFFRDVVFVSSASVSSLSLNPFSLIGGSSSTGTVTLTSAAPAGGAVVALSSNNAAAFVPASVTVPANSTTAMFTITTTAVSSATSAGISAIYNGSRSATLTINAPALSTMTLNPASVTGGGSSTGTVTLTGPAPAGGALVTLSSNNAVAAVPASVTVPAGSSTRTFTVTTNAVSSATSAGISAAYNGSKSATLAVNPPALLTMIVNPASVTGGTPATGTAILNGPAPAGGAVVALSGLSPIVQGIQGVHSPADLPHDGSIDWAGVGPLYSSMPANPLSITGMPGATVTISTTTALPMILSNCSSGGSCAWYGNFASGASVLWTGGTYHSSNGSWTANGPMTITFSIPQRGLGFHIMADELGPFTATLCAYNSSDSPLGCIPFSGDATAAADGSAAYVGLYDDVAEIAKITVDAGGKFFPHDFAIGHIYVANTRRQMVPATVTVPAGATGATFPVSTNSVPTNTIVNITGTYVVSQSSSLAIDPPALSSVAVDPNSVAGGSAATGTATLNGPAPVGGSVVTLSGTNSAFTGLQAVHSLKELPQGGSIDWGTVGPLYSLVSSGVVMPVAGMDGTTATISTATGFPGMTMDNCGGGVCGFYGNFMPGAKLLWVGGAYSGPSGSWIGNGPLTLTFNTPQRGVGFHLMADEAGPFTATVCAYSSTTTLLGCVPFTGNGTNAADGSAIVVGLYNDAADIYKVTVDAGGTLYPHDFAIGRLRVTNAQRQLVPTTVMVPAGAVSANFGVTTNSVTSTTSTTITGTYAGAKSTTLEIHP